MSELNGKVIYVGGIPYDQTEEQVLDIAKSVGPVVNTRLVFDKETGKSKGFAFVEYADEETASSAVRNLNNYMIGNRAIKCSFSNESFSNFSNGSNNIKGKRRTVTKDEIPPLPAGLEVMDPRPENLAGIVSSSLNNLDGNRLKNLINDAKIMSKSNPEMMVKLLKQNPQLSYALVQAALLLNLTDSKDIAGLLHNPGLANAPSAPQNNGSTTGGTSDFDEISEEQKQMIRQILAMTDEQIQQVPEDQRFLIVQLKQKYANVR
ncbi:unnamed protein product [Kuraishia capsulata CBS 1993]|uniref:RRM domain-containing protein n=1 Tax=Kuraishia capsulata CBS 1993 TaxID=1382522 RepID=W6MN71_9ASCO|nr:uncharacterized protein KUCA_T00003687001 [Kuraishia capsulata CBS 1993]CDK27708.1 unnamed protein product [Kuraishia capsulata CBS 1993]